MSRKTKGSLFAAALVLAIGAVVLVASARLMEGGSIDVRELYLTADDMAFRANNGAPISQMIYEILPNPTLHVKAGERVRLVFSNQDGGIHHDFSIVGFEGTTTPVLRPGESTTLEFIVPATIGTYEYVCTLHSVMMHGALVVTD